jgi:uncharacterized membrane protein
MISTTHLHPMLVHFPIALVVLGFIAEVASIYVKKEPCLSRLGFYLLIIGTVSALSALLAGIFFTGEMSGSAGEAQETHEMLAWITLGTLLVASVLRMLLELKKRENARLKWIALILYGLGAVSVSVTGFYGGILVYNYMMTI